MSHYQSIALELHRTVLQKRVLDAIRIHQTPPYRGVECTVRSIHDVMEKVPGCGVSVDTIYPQLKHLEEKGIVKKTVIQTKRQGSPTVGVYKEILNKERRKRSCH